MNIRACLDYVAACVFLLKGDWGNFRAVIQARKEYARLRPQFKADRQENLDKAVGFNVSGRFSFSILWQSKVRGHKKYSDLPVK